jgi:mono/diheme cytochrome c family protein
VDNQFAQPKALTQRLILVAIAVLLLIFAITLGIYFNWATDPYVEEVLSLKGDITRGHAIFQTNCAGCHGLQADGIVGPSLHDVPKRKSRVSLIYQVTSGETPPMPKFQPKPQDMADLLNYLENL